MEGLEFVYYLIIAAAIILLAMGIYIAYLMITTLILIKSVLTKFEKGTDEIKKEFYELKNTASKGLFSFIRDLISRKRNNN